jgi:endonuclease YncB( thermonuclease family)
VPQRGTPGLHLIVDRGPSTSLRAGDGLAVDLGFMLYWPLTPDQAKRLAKGTIVRIANDDSIHRADGATKAELFTYAATLRRVVDGDTLVVALEVSPGVFLEQKLRLRGLDCPELSTPEGKAAKRFVEALFSDSIGDLVINTTKPDKYDRYLADVFVKTKSGEEVFLNNALLENGHAVRKDAADFGENWDRM